ncbi:hypothetical protein [Gordonia effusa]|nr:hypothetical protein [Gordonia effusa]
MTTTVHVRSAAESASSAFAGGRIRSSCIASGLSILAIVGALIVVVVL